jgi:pimeloyl-ACP methyl ester carboxylesterase
VGFSGRFLEWALKLTLCHQCFLEWVSPFKRIWFFEGFSVEFVQFGREEGQLVIYFHGAPGALEECVVFERFAQEQGLRIICFDRFAIESTFDREDYYQAITHQILLRAGNDPVVLIGFSIGAHVALEVGARLGDQVRQTHLISAAAPLNAGDFLDSMAGGVVFKLAMKAPRIFYLLSQYQKLVALLAPKALVNMLFASAAGNDRSLRENREFRSYITPILKHCFLNRLEGYVRDIQYYVTWSGEFDRNKTPVCLWHGAEDNWSPLSMATALSQTLPGAVSVEVMEGLSHYSCLYSAAPKICARIEGR